MKSAIKAVLKNNHTEIYDEAAFPAYSNPNPFIDFLFWERLYQAIRMIDYGSQQKENILDFGCGSGAMLPYLSSISNTIWAMDINLEPAMRINKIANFNKNIKFITSIDNIKLRSIDVIVALDVLEHVQDLEKTLVSLSSLLSDDGKIVVSGPTENILYKLGRFIAGSDYSGDYHNSNIYQIKECLKKHINIDRVVKLYLPVPLFIVFSGTK